MGINGWELMVLLVVAILVIGPERLPQAAEQLARLVRELRKLATGARDRVREELGPEVADIDLSKLDPRQYDPRRIVREALMEDLDTPAKPAAATNGTKAATNGTKAGAAGSAAPTLTNPAAVVAKAQGAAAGGAAAAQDGQRAPFDDEAT